jgi:hypothetical protein
MKEAIDNLLVKIMHSKPDDAFRYSEAVLNLSRAQEILVALPLEIKEVKK